MKLNVSSKITILIAMISSTGLADLSFSSRPVQAAVDNCPFAAGRNVRNSFNILHEFGLKARPQTPIIRAAWRWELETLAKGKPPAMLDSKKDGLTQQFGIVNGVIKDSHPLEAMSGHAKANAFVAVEIKPIMDNSTVNIGNRACGRNIFDSKLDEKARSLASSKIQFGFGSKDAKGQISWKPGVQFNYTDTASGVVNDPIDFSVLNLDTNQTQTSRLLDISFKDIDNSQLFWEDGNVHLNGQNATFILNLTSPFITSGQGTMLLIFKDGLVTESEDTGIFDGLLPLVGSQASTDFHIGDSLGNIIIDYDFGDTNTNGYQLDINLSGDGSVAEAIPEPSANLSLLSLVTLGAGATLKRKLKPSKKV